MFNPTFKMADKDYSDCEATDMADNFGIPEVPIWNKPGRKSSASAERCRVFANMCFDKKDFKRALKFYNASLCYAPPGSEEIPMCYANRSAIFCEAGEFGLALENIELARKNGYPAEKMAKLDAREDKCKKLMEKFGPKMVKFDNSFFKLSHPPNEKIPFIAGCLELRKNEKYGRHIITNTDLKTGDIIAIEPAVIVWPDLNTSKHCCLFCAKSQLVSLIPCSHCTKVMFCSEECRDKAAPFHLIDLPSDEANHGMFKNSLKMMFEAYRIAGGVDEALELLKDSEGKTIFDFDFSDPNDPDYEKKMLVALNGLYSNVHDIEGIEPDLLLGIPPINEKPRTADQRKQILNFIKNQFRICCSNMTMSFKDNFYVISLFKNLINHSCAQNIQFGSVDDLQISYVCRPIKAGEQLFVSYGVYPATESRDERQMMLNKTFQFKCDCEACVNNWPKQFPRKDRRFVEPKDTDLESAASIERFKKNCKYIDKNAKKMPCYEVQKLMDELNNLICSIADIEVD